jgi:tetratricopeptide (TPR) repeat protein
MAAVGDDVAGPASAAGRSRSRWRDGWIAGAVLACALGVRFLVFLDARDAPFWRVPLLDEKIYLDLARDLLAGKPPAHGAFYIAPGYAYFLALVLALGGGIIAVKVANLLAGACSAALVALLARRCSGRGAALAAGLVWALYPAELLQEILLLKSALTVLCVLMCLVAITADGARSPSRPPSPGRWALAGACMGLAVLLRPELLLAAAAIAAAAFLARRRRWPGAPSRAALALFALGVLAAVAVPTAQNFVSSRDLVVVAYGGGPNFYIGNHAEAHGGYVPLLPDRGDPALEETDAVALAVQASGRPLAPSAVSRFWWRRGLAWWRAEPARALQLTAKKWALLWGPRQLADGLSTEQAGRWVAALRLRAVGPALVLPAALAGMWLLCRRREHWPLYAMLLGMQLGILPFFLFERFRLHLVAVALPFAAAAGVLAWDRARARDARQLMAGLAATAALGGILAIPRVPIDAGALRGHLGTLLFSAGRYSEALGEFEAARAARPNSPRLDLNIATAQAALRNLEAAAAALDRALPGLHAEAARTGLAAAEELSYGHDLAGEIQRILGRLAAAEGHYRAALEFAPAAQRAELEAKLAAVVALRAEREGGAPGTRPPASGNP